MAVPDNPEVRREDSMIDRLSPRERQELERALERGEGWARVISGHFLEGNRLKLGIDQAVSEERIAAVSGLDAVGLREAIVTASRFCAEHGLHLLGFPEAGPEGPWRHFMAVG